MEVYIIYYSYYKQTGNYVKTIKLIDEYLGSEYKQDRYIISTIEN